MGVNLHWLRNRIGKFSVGLVLFALAFTATCPPAFASKSKGKSTGCDMEAWRYLKHSVKLKKWLQKTQQSVAAEDFQDLLKFLDKRKMQHRRLSAKVRKQYNERMLRFLDNHSGDPTETIRTQLMLMARMDIKPTPIVLKKIYKSGLRLESSSDAGRLIANTLHSFAVLGVNPPSQFLNKFYRAYASLESASKPNIDFRNVNQMRFADLYFRRVLGKDTLPKLRLPLKGERSKTETLSQTYVAIALETLGDRVRYEHFLPELNTHVDFLIDNKTILEVDGQIHFWLDDQGNRIPMLKDQRRDEILRSLGYQVERIANEDILQVHQYIESIR